MEGGGGGGGGGERVAGGGVGCGGWRGGGHTAPSISTPATGFIIIISVLQALPAAVWPLRTILSLSRSPSSAAAPAPSTAFQGRSEFRAWGANHFNAPEEIE